MVGSISSSEELELEESLEDELESLEESDVIKSVLLALSAIAATSGLSFRKILKEFPMNLLTIAQSHRQGTRNANTLSPFRI